MEIKDIKDALSNIDIIVDVVHVSQPREVNVSGNIQKVSDAIVKDSSGEFKLTLWNEHITTATANIGKKIHIEKGFLKSFQNDWSINIPKAGKLIPVI